MDVKTKYKRQLSGLELSGSRADSRDFRPHHKFVKRRAPASARGGGTDAGSAVFSISDVPKHSTRKNSPGHFPVHSYIPGARPGHTPLSPSMAAAPMSTYPKTGYPKTLGIILAAAILYTLVRYIHFGDVSATQTPLFLFNKVLAFASAILFLVSAMGVLQRKKNLAKYAGRHCFNYAVLHSILSLILLSPDYYPKLYGGASDSTLSQFSVLGGVSLLAGGLCLLLFWNIREKMKEKAKGYGLKLAASLAVLIHLIAYGGPGWLTPLKWHGYLPPITLLSALVILPALAIYYRKRAGAARH